MSRLCILILIVSVISIKSFGQTTNTDPKQSFIHVNVPRTPESSGFEKYGDNQVNEFTGTSSISIPLYTLKSKFLEAPITLNYQASGIKVNQEASWVGLGFDLQAGGRITVETKGSVDFCGSTRGLSSHVVLAQGMQRIFDRLGNSRENAVLTPSTFCDNQSCEEVNPGFDYLHAIQEMTEFGTGEPDIFRANFAGNSISFYIDKITNQVFFIGEQSLFKIDYTLDELNNIVSWTLVDNLGNYYYFNQTETTTNTIAASAIVPNSSTSAWLLTKIVHPTGDYIQFSYNNYGYSIPAFTMNGSVSWLVTSGAASPSVDQQQNISLQAPYYLTKIETETTAVEFLLDTRTDLYGPGSRKLVGINVRDKLSNQIKKTITFTQSYFQSNYSPWSAYLNSLTYNLPSPLTTAGYIACSNRRLRLDAVRVDDASLQAPFLFSYNETVVDKYSYSQDHWGYYNAVNNTNNGFQFTHLIPYSGINAVYSSIPETRLSPSVIGVSRDCDPVAMQAMILTKITYPTGGSTEFVYEPHVTVMVPVVNVIGGGLRVTTIKNFSLGKLAGITNYSYTGGKYMGNIRYFTTASVLSSCSGGQDGGGYMKYTSSGVMNDNDILLGYHQITKIQTDENGRSNGKTVKDYNITTSSSSYSNNSGFDIMAPYFPPGEQQILPTGQTFEFWLDAQRKAFAPTPASILEGKLLQEQYFDNNDNLLKSVNYEYSIANYRNAFYDIKAVENRSGGFSACASGSPEEGISTGGNRPVILFVSPAKSFHILLDSKIEKNNSGSSYISDATSYTYNPYYQKKSESHINSDGTETIKYIQTSAELGSAYHYTLPPTSDANLISNLGTAHIYDLPVEETVLNKAANGDLTVVSSQLTIYNGVIPQKVYVAETAHPLVYNSQFIPLYFNYAGYPSYPANDLATFRMDDHYKLYSSGEYGSSGLIRSLHTLQGKSSYIWDEFNNQMMAQCVNADFANVAATSFETSATGGWQYQQSGVIGDPSAPTGKNVYSLLTSGLSITGLSSAAKYVVSYWSKTNNAYVISGSTAMKKGRSYNGWTYFEHTVSDVTSVQVSGDGAIDELRLYPVDAQMTTYTYEPQRGTTSVCDLNNKISYYSYDSIGRLQFIRDMDGNIIKTFDYHHQSIPGYQH